MSDAIPDAVMSCNIYDTIRKHFGLTNGDMTAMCGRIELVDVDANQQLAAKDAKIKELEAERDQWKTQFVELQESSRKVAALADAEIERHRQAYRREAAECQKEMKRRIETEVKVENRDAEIGRLRERKRRLTEKLGRAAEREIALGKRARAAEAEIERLQKEAHWRDDTCYRDCGTLKEAKADNKALRDTLKDVGAQMEMAEQCDVAWLDLAKEQIDKALAGKPEDSGAEGTGMSKWYRVEGEKLVPCNYRADKMERDAGRGKCLRCGKPSGTKWLCHDCEE